MQWPSRFLFRSPIAVWYEATDAICRGNRVQVQQSANSDSVLNRAAGLAGETLCVYMAVIRLNQASFDYFLVQMSHAAFAIVQGQYQ